MNCVLRRVYEFTVYRSKPTTLEHIYLSISNCSYAGRVVGQTVNVAGVKYIMGKF